jgi:hypothetical protein
VYSDELWVGRLGIESRKRQNFLFSAISIPALRLTQPHTQWLLGALSPGVKRPRHEADYMPSSNAEIKNGEAKRPLLDMSS